MINPFQCLRNQGHGERRSWVMDATYKGEEPFLGPNSFAGIVLRTEWFTVKVWGKSGMVCETPPFHCKFAIVSLVVAMIM